MKNEQTVRIFSDGHNRLLPLPLGFAAASEFAIVRQDGDRLVVEVAARKETLLDLLDRLEPLGPDDRWEPIESLPARDVDL